MLRNAKRRSAFTVIELVAVASIMAILSLILVQQLRVRVEESRKSAAMADLRTLANIITLCQAETRNYFPLQCYASINLPDSWIIRDPGGQWMQHTDNVPTLLASWAGPYTTFNNSLSMDRMATSFGYLISPSGPIYPVQSTDMLRELRYPLDPWGNPYIVSFLNGSLNSKSIEVRAVYSLGPDGRPGAASTATNPADYRPWNRDAIPNSGELGREGSDDLKNEF